VRIKTPAGGSRTWQWTDAGNNEREARVIRGLLVCYLVRGTLWGRDEVSKGVQPVLQTYDLATATRLNDDLGDLDAEQLEACRIGDRLYDWKRLPWNQYGTGKGGAGKRCKESRLLGILQPGEAWPVIVTAGPGSLKTVPPFVRRLTVPHFQAIVELSLEKQTSSGGIDYSRIVPKFVGTISREDGATMRRLYTEPLSRIAAEIGDDAEVGGGD